MRLVPLSEPRESLLPFSALGHVRIQQEVCSLQRGRGSLSELNHLGTLISDFQPLEP